MPPPPPAQSWAASPDRSARYVNIELGGRREGPIVQKKLATSPPKWSRPHRVQPITRAPFRWTANRLPTPPCWGISCRTTCCIRCSVFSNRLARAPRTWLPVLLVSSLPCRATSSSSHCGPFKATRSLDPVTRLSWCCTESAMIAAFQAAAPNKLVMGR